MRHNISLLRQFLRGNDTVAAESHFVEVACYRLCPREGKFGIQVPQGAWHTVEVHEPSVIFEAKDGAYGR